MPGGAKPTEVTCVQARRDDRTGDEDAVHRQTTSAPSTVPAATPSRAAAAGSRATRRTSENGRTNGSI